MEDKRPIFLEHFEPQILTNDRHQFRKHRHINLEILIHFGDIDTFKEETIFHLRNLRVAALSATELEVSIIISNNHSKEKCSKKFKNNYKWCFPFPYAK